MCKGSGGGMINVFLLPAELYTFLGKVQIRLISSIGRVDSETYRVVPGALRSLLESFNLKLNLSFYTHHGTIKAYQDVRSWVLSGDQ